MEFDSHSHIEKYSSLIQTVSQEFYDGRMQYMQTHFNGLEDDTVYVEKTDTAYYWPSSNGESFFEVYDDLSPEEEDALQPLYDEGFEYLGLGASRVALEFPETDLVVKFGRYGWGDEWGDGRLANMLEERIYQEYKETPVPLLPVLDSDVFGLWMVMPKLINTLDTVSEDVREREMQRLIDLCDTHIEELSPESIDPYEIGKWNDSLWIADYGRQRFQRGPRGLPDHIPPEMVLPSKIADKYTENNS